MTGFYCLVVKSEKKTRGTLFAKLDDVFPECGLLIKESDRMERFQCFIDSCHVSANCMERLVRRVKPMFDTFPTVDLIYLHYRRRSDNRMRAGLFWRDVREPRLLSVNTYAWERMKTYGQVFIYEPPPGFYGIGAEARGSAAPEPLLRVVAG